MFNVFIDNLDTRLPRIALFSTRTINAGEELTFDYQMKGSGGVSSDSIDHSPAKKEGQNCVQMWSCDLQRLPQLNFQEIELKTIIVFFLMLTFYLSISL